MTPWKISTALLGVSLLTAPAFASGQAADSAPAAPQQAVPYEQAAPGQAAAPAAANPYNDIAPGPGMVNYVEGAVYLDGQPLSRNSVGSAEMAAGQVLETHQGKAEILLNPGIYLRVDDHSAVKMISPSITPTQVEVLRGRAGIEVDQLLKQNVVQVMNQGVTTQLVKTGYYEFNANNGQVKVFKGQAEVQYASNKWAKVKDNHQMTLQQGVKQQEVKFEANPQEDQLMQWSKLRSQYLAEANQQMAPEFYGAGYYPGWYWDPYMFNYTFIGGGPFYSPFGWGFYPLGWGFGGIGWGGFYGHGFYHGGFVGHGDVGSGFRGGMGGGGFHGGMGGGFHGGGGRG